MSVQILALLTKARAIGYSVLAVLCAGGAGRAPTTAPLVEITNAVVRPGEALHVWVTCAARSRAADVRSPATQHFALNARTADGSRFAAPPVAARARPGDYLLAARCIPGSGAPSAAATAPFRVSEAPQQWAAESRTAESITGDARFSPVALAFAGGTLRIHYLRDVPGSVSAVGGPQAHSHAGLYRVLSASDLRLLAGNLLCGKPPTYTTVLRTAAELSADIVVTIYSGSSEPDETSSDAICASYTYFPKGLEGGK
jgi:hypothetical protein